MRNFVVSSSVILIPLLSLIIMSNLSCDMKGSSGGVNPAKENPKDLDKDPEKDDENKTDETCSLPAGSKATLESIADVVTMLNSLAKPVTIPCFVEVLARPLYLNATSSIISVQPAVSKEIPRIFLFSGEKLLVTFVPEGEGSKMIEFSELLSDFSSVKAEIPFPVTEELSENSPYTSILNKSGSGTKCSACHGAETAAPDGYSDKAFASNALKPIPSSNVSLITLEEQRQLCADSNAEKCEILRALMDHGEIIPKNFPQNMPTIF